MKRFGVSMLKHVHLTALLLTGCASTVPDISPAVLSHRMQTGETPLIVDVRSESEYRQGHIPGAVHVPFLEASKAPPEVIKACKQKMMVVTCEHGPRAVYAAPRLRDLGCRDVRLLEGHMHRWREQGYLMTAPGQRD